MLVRILRTALVSVATLVLLAITLVYCSCRPHTQDVKESTLIREFFQTHDSAQRIQEFRKHNLDEQYDLYLWGCQVIHPPELCLARPLAENGPAVVPFLTRKLESARDEDTVRDIALVLSDVAELKLYDFSKNPKLMELLDRKAHAMQGSCKATTLESIWQIRAAGGGKVAPALLF